MRGSMGFPRPMVKESKRCTDATVATTPTTKSATSTPVLRFARSWLSKKSIAIVMCLLRGHARTSPTTPRAAHRGNARRTPPRP